MPQYPSHFKKIQEGYVEFWRDVWDVCVHLLLQQETFWNLLTAVDFCMGNPRASIQSAYSQHWWVYCTCMHLCIYITTCSSAKRGTSCFHLESLRLFVRSFSANRCPFRLTGPCRAKWRAGVISSCQKMAVTRLHMPVGRWVSADNYIKEGIKEGACYNLQ